MASLANAQHLVFTVRTHPSCPLSVSTLANSKDYGFVSADFRNISGKSVEAVDLKVSLSTNLGEQIVDGAGFYLTLAPGQIKRLDIGLAPMKDINERARRTGKEIAQVAPFVETVRFSDGTDWNGQEPVIWDQPPPHRQ